MAKDVMSIAWTDMCRRKFATAIQLLESKADIYEDNFEYYLMTGTACLYVGDIGAASSYFQKARRIKLTDTRLLLGQAAIYLRRGDTDRALQYYLEIKENDPENKIAAKAMEFIRVRGNYDTICRWVDTGKIEQFYPPVGINPDKVFAVFAGFVLACALCSVFLFVVRPRANKYNFLRADLAALELTSQEKSSAKEKDLTAQSYKYILTNKEITKRYNDALQYFQTHRDNAAQMEVNAILNSDATLSIKQKAQVLAGYFDVPDFDSIRDVPAFSDASKNPILYLDCWVDWGGKISNAVTYPDGTYSCDLLVGDDGLLHYEGTVTVRFDSVPVINGEENAKILGRIIMEDGKLCLKGRSVYQKINNKKL